MAFSPEKKFREGIIGGQFIFYTKKMKNLASLDKTKYQDYKCIQNIIMLILFEPIHITDMRKNGDTNGASLNVLILI